MEKKQKAIQVYAIIICIIAIITIIISLSALITAMIDSGDPLYANRYDTHITSFENFKLNALKSITKDQAYIPTEAELLKMYEDAKANKIRMVEHQTNRTIIVSSFIIGIALLLFGSHWWLMKKIGRTKAIE